MVKLYSTVNLLPLVTSCMYTYTHSHAHMLCYWVTLFCMNVNVGISDQTDFKRAEHNLNTLF